MPLNRTEIDEVVRAADVAMYQAKRAGGDRFALSTRPPEVRPTVRRRSQIRGAPRGPSPAAAATVRLPRNTRWRPREPGCGTPLQSTPWLSDAVIGRSLAATAALRAFDRGGRVLLPRMFVCSDRTMRLRGPKAATLCNPVVRRPSARRLQCQLLPATCGDHRGGRRGACSGPAPRS